VSSKSSDAVSANAACTTVAAPATLTDELPRW